ncbi:sensor domain-containing diguanylate cyclase [Marilutibacter chinensis]|uniref:diguanylate cyclase n=1 Tax=Marilutibacter chinensis TaxID=2912247 RepID=A0ABS9HRU8_9GAMM|nr:diguanylate cyclase [Lysobacter chinensis]MCF7220807.1 sensor domain-containing diguanylate cyclase [Lysobacter chinensis]
MRIRGFWPGVVLGLLLLSGFHAHPGHASEMAPALLPKDSSEFVLAPHVSFLHDVAGGMRLEDAVAARRDGAFAPLPGGNNSFGFQDGAFWFHARIVNRDPDESQWLLVQQYPLSDSIDLYALHPDGRMEHHQGGDHRPFSARSVRYRHPNFWLDLPADQPVDLFIRIQSESSMQVPLRLYTPTAFAEMSRDVQFGIGLYYGILLSLFFYNLVLWLTTRDSSYFWYVFHLTAFGLVLFTLNGLGFEYLWPDSAWMADRSVPLSICLAQVGVQQFARRFLDLRNRWPTGDRVGLGLIGFFLLLGVASAFLPYRISTPFASASVFISVGWVAVEAIVAIRRGYAPARIFLLAWATFLVGTAMFASVAFALLPKTFVTEYGVQIGSALEMLLLSIALGHRYAALRNENERIVRDAKRQLEHQVEKRTRELSEALGQLGDAHARLRESSQRDALTGLHTRRHFHEQLAPMLEEARSGGRPLSLLMIDLDHFKEINDRHGHLAGDACLRWAAHAIGDALRPHRALVARFGGEEFVAALPDHDLAAATAAAEKIRHQLDSAPCEALNRKTVVTTSIGVHQIDIATAGGIDAALERADRALYQAKAEGRNCVRTSTVAG